jgi:hypothetical protein
MGMRIHWMIPILTATTLGAGCAEPEPIPPPEPEEFESFRMTWGSGPCPPNGDCEGSIELLADGTLRLDTPCGGQLACDGLIPGTYEAVVSAEDLEAAIEALTAPDLIELLDGARPVCEPPTDIFESVAVVIGDDEYSNETTTCEDTPLERARNAMSELVKEYFGPGAPVLLGGGWSFGFCQGACVGQFGLNGAAARFTITGHQAEDPVFLDNRGILTEEGLEAVYMVMVELRDVPLEERYGCPDCDDGGASHVTIAREDGSSMHTYEFGEPPPELAELDALLGELISALETCVSTAYIEIDPGCMPRSE